MVISLHTGQVTGYTKWDRQSIPEPLRHNKALLLLRKAYGELAQQYLICYKDSTIRILYKDKKLIPGSTVMNGTSWGSSRGTGEAVGTPYGVKNKRRKVNMVDLYEDKRVKMKHLWMKLQEKAIHRLIYKSCLGQVTRPIHLVNRNFHTK